MLSFLAFLENLNDFFLGYIALVFISTLGIYFTIKTRFFQWRTFPEIIRTFYQFLVHPPHTTQGTHPLHAFFASVGGMIGIGNVVAVTTAVTVGGPGALLWIWVTAWVGSLIKYSEIYLGHKYRVANQMGGYDGGPMFFLKAAYHSKWVKWAPTAVCLLLVLYGTEIYQFSVIVHSVTTNFNLPSFPVITGLLALILLAGLGGVSRVGKICSFFIPFFTLAYLGMCFWIILNNLPILPSILKEVFFSAFQGHAPIGGFLGSSVWVGLQQGAARAAYSADIGIGYDSVIQSESKTQDPSKQARLSILGVLIDNLVCTCSILIVLITGIWKAENPVAGSALAQQALSLYFPGMQVFVPILIFVLGYSTIIAYYCVCLKCARYLYPKWGAMIYAIVSVPIFTLFSFYDQSQALLVMSIAQSLLLVFNLTGIFKLRKDIEFN